MKAAPEAQLRLLELAELDMALDRLQHRRRSLPELAELAKVETSLAQLDTQVAGLEMELGDLVGEQAKAETDVDQVRTRADRDRRRLDAGQVSSPKELENLQSEIVSLDRRQHDLEEIVLELMERRESVERRLAEASKERDELTARRTAVQERRDAAFADIDNEVGEARRRRSAITATLPGDVLALYEKLRVQYGGVGAAALHRGRCEGCKLTLSAVDLGRIKTAAQDEVLRCEECRRILVRTPQSGA